MSNSEKLIDGEENKDVGDDGKGWGAFDLVLGTSATAERTEYQSKQE